VGVGADYNGTLFVADQANNLIRAVTPAGVVTTVAGGGCTGCTGAGFADGYGSAARFNTPSAVAADRKGTLCVSDTSNNRLRVVWARSGALVATVAGGGASLAGVGTNVALNAPYGLALVGNSVLYVADNWNIVRKVVLGAGADDDDIVASSVAAVSVLAGGGGGGTLAGYVDAVGTNARFNGVRRLAAAGAGSLYVSDFSNNLVRVIATASGAVTTLAGGNGGINAGFANGVGTNAMFSGPTGLALDGRGSLFVGDWNNYCVRVIALATGAVSLFAGTRANANSYANGAAALSIAMTNPYDVAISPLSGAMFVTPQNSHHVLVLVSPSPSPAASPHHTRTPTPTATFSRLTTPSPSRAPAVALVSAWAGGGRSIAAGWADGVGSAALFSAPTGVFALAACAVMISPAAWYANMP
jgi:hypothetical protein